MCRRVGRRTRQFLCGHLTLKTKREREKKKEGKIFYNKKSHFNFKLKMFLGVGPNCSETYGRLVWNVLGRDVDMSDLN